MRWAALLSVLAMAGPLVGQNENQPTAEKQTFTLQFKAKKGDEYFLHTKTVTNSTSVLGQTRIEQEFIWHIKVEKVTENGNIHSRWKALLVRTKQDFPLLGKGYFDSEKGKAKGIIRNEAARLNALIENGVSVEMTRTGRVVSGRIRNIPSLGFLPKKPVKVGDSWTVEESGDRQQQTKTIFRCTLKKVKVVDGNKLAVIELELLKLKVNPVITGRIDAKGGGTVLFDIDRGMAIKHNLTVRLTHNITNPTTGEVVKTVTNIKESGEILKEKPKCNPKKVRLIGGGGVVVPVPLPPPPKKEPEPEKSR